MTDINDLPWRRERDDAVQRLVDENRVLRAENSHYARLWASTENGLFDARRQLADAFAAGESLAAELVEERRRQRMADLVRGLVGQTNDEARAAWRAVGRMQYERDLLRRDRDVYARALREVAQFDSMLAGSQDKVDHLLEENAILRRELAVATRALREATKEPATRLGMGRCRVDFSALGDACAMAAAYDAGRRDEVSARYATDVPVGETRWVRFNEYPPSGSICNQHVPYVIWRKQ